MKKFTPHTFRMGQNARIDSLMPFLMVIWLVIGNEYEKSAGVQAADWAQWRGPARNAISLDTGLMQEWPGDGPRLAWHASGLGKGYSSVVVARGRVITIGRHENVLYCYAINMANGARVWSVQVGKTARIPCSTPTIDGDRIFVLDPDGELLCLDWNDGHIIWQTSYSADFSGQMQSGRGYGESPLVDGEKLICTPGGADAMLVALNKRDGSVIWKTRRPDLGEAGRNGAGFSSVVLSQGAGVRQYVQLVGRGLVGVAARDGRFLWGHNKIANRTANIPTPIVSGDYVFSANGYNAGSVLVKLVAQADGSIQAQKVYDLNGSQFQNHHGGVVLIGDYLYGGHGSNNGLPTCLELMSGKVVWKRRGPGVGSAAVVAADGHLYFRYQNGLVGLLQATPDGYRLKGKLQIPGAGADSWSHPVIANGRLLLREKNDLWVYDLTRPANTVATSDSDAPQVKADPALRMLLKQGVSIRSLVKSGVSRDASADTRRQNRLLAYTAAGAPEQSPQPVVLTLNNSHLTPQGMVRASVMGQLKQVSTALILRLAGTRVSDTGLEQIARIQKVVGLDLELCTQLSDSGLKRLSLCSGLRTLILTGTQVTDAGLRELAQLQHLQALDLEVCDGVTDQTCSAIASLTQLRALVLKKTGFEPQRVGGRGLAALSGLEYLEFLNLYGNQLSDADLVHLAKMPQLKTLNLDLLGITDQGLQHLQVLKHLGELSLVYSEGFAGPKLTDRGLQSLQTIMELKSLNLTGAKLTDDAVGRLQVHSQLEQLVLVNTGLSDAGLKRLKASLPKCRIIR